MNQHLKRAVQPIGWETYRGGLQAIAKPSKRHYYGGQSYDDYLAGEKAKTLCGVWVPKGALPGAPRVGMLDTKVSAMYPHDLSSAEVCGRCDRAKTVSETANLDDNGRPIDGGA